MTEKKRPLAEVLTGVFINELHVLHPDSYPPYDNTSDEHRKAFMGAMHKVVGILSLFALDVDEAGTVIVRGSPEGGKALADAMSSSKPDPSDPPKARKILKSSPPPSFSPTELSAPEISLSERKHLGYTGDFCNACGSMQVIQNGSCYKCLGCGTTTGCS